MLNSKSRARTIFSLLTLSVFVSFIGAGCVAPRSAHVVETTYETTSYPRSSLYLSLHHKKKYYGSKHYYKKPVCKKTYSYKKTHYKKGYSHKKSYSHKKGSSSRSRSRRR